MEAVANGGKFDVLSLPKPIMDCIASLGFTQMTPVQAASIPLFLKESNTYYHLQVEDSEFPLDAKMGVFEHICILFRKPNQRQVFFIYL